MAGQQSDNLAVQVAQRVTDRAQGIAKQIAQNIGAPVDATKIPRSDQAALWHMPNPQADPMLVQQLLAQGQHQQAVDLMYPGCNFIRWDPTREPART
jgi:hypothetical protein